MFLWQTESSDVSAPLGSVEGFSICFPLCLMVKSSRGKYFLKNKPLYKPAVWYVSRILLKLAASYNLAAGTQTRQVNKGKAKKRQGITCQPIGKCVAVKRSCVVWEQDPFQGICCKKTNRKLGEGDWYIYILVVTQEQVDVGVGWIWPVWKVCEYLVDGEWQEGKFLRNAWAWVKWEMAWDWGRVRKIKTTEIAVLTGVFSCWKAAERYFPQKLESELKGRRRNTEFIFTRWPEIWAWMDVSVVKSSCLLVNVHPVSLKTQQFWPVGWPHQFCYFVKI